MISDRTWAIQKTDVCYLTNVLSSCLIILVSMTKQKYVFHHYLGHWFWIVTPNDIKSILHLKTYSVLYSTYSCTYYEIWLDFKYSERKFYSTVNKLSWSVLIQTHSRLCGNLRFHGSPSKYSVLILTLHLQSNPAHSLADTGRQRFPETVSHHLRLMLQFPVNTRWHVWLHPPWEGDMFADAMYSFPFSAAECLNEDIYYNRDTED